MKDQPVANLTPLILHSSLFGEQLELRDASVVFIPRELVVHFCLLSRYAVAPLMSLAGIPGYDLFSGGRVMIPPFQKATFNMPWRLK